MRRQIITLAIVAFLFAAGGTAAGYAFGRSSQEALVGLTGLPLQYTAATSASALQLGNLVEYHELGELSEYHDIRPRYLLGTDHGFVAVFSVSDELGLTLKERTRTPESALAPDERERLSGGIHLYTEEQLFRALQDYGS